MLPKFLNYKFNKRSLERKQQKTRRFFRCKRKIGTGVQLSQSSDWFNTFTRNWNNTNQIRRPKSRYPASKVNQNVDPGIDTQLVNFRRSLSRPHLALPAFSCAISSSCILNRERFRETCRNIGGNNNGSSKLITEMPTDILFGDDLLTPQEQLDMLNSVTDEDEMNYLAFLGLQNYLSKNATDVPESFINVAAALNWVLTSPTFVVGPLHTDKLALNICPHIMTTENQCHGCDEDSKRSLKISKCNNKRIDFINNFKKFDFNE